MEEIEQHNKELCKENRELKDTCVSLQKQNSDTQAELHKTQVWPLVRHEPARQLNKPAKREMNLECRGQKQVVSLLRHHFLSGP